MPDVIEKTKESFVRAKNALARHLTDVPDERAAWSPSPTARTPVELVAHAAFAIGSIGDMQRGTVFPITSTEEADAFFRKWESEYRTKDQALALLEENSRQYLAFLDTITEDDLGQLVPLPFSLGEVPLEASLTVAIDHTQFHVAQLDYIQTIYGDRDWHM